MYILPMGASVIKNAIQFASEFDKAINSILIITEKKETEDRERFIEAVRRLVVESQYSFTQITDKAIATALSAKK